MPNLKEYIRYTDQSKLFKPGEFTGPIRFIYTAIGSAVIDDADTMVITPNGFKWYKQNVFVGKFLGDDMTVPDPNFNVLIHKVLEHDSILQSHLDITLETPDETKVNIQY